MELINIENLQSFGGEHVAISIQDHEGGEQAPSVHKVIKNVQLCPDGTHVRFYFDQFYFLAVPLTSKVNKTTNSWSAYDQDSGLTYTIKKIRA